MKRKAISVDPGIGKILVSEPFLLDSYFKRSVILLGEHSEEGTVGFILNKQTDDAQDNTAYLQEVQCQQSVDNIPEGDINDNLLEINIKKDTERNQIINYKDFCKIQSRKLQEVDRDPSYQWSFYSNFY